MKKDINFLELFDSITVKELNERINYYRNYISIRNLSEEKIKNEIEKIFTVEMKNEKYSFFLNDDILTQPNQIENSYRIRKFEKEDYRCIEKMKFKSVISKEDVLCVPDNLTNKYGRLNRPGKSVLYLSKEIQNAVYETRVKYNEFFFLTLFKNKKQLRISQVHNISYHNELTELQNAKRLLMNGFLHNEFIKYVAPGREYEYKSTLIIYENYFKHPLIDAFCYPSIATATKRGYNLCVQRDKIESNLDIVMTFVCKLLPPERDNEFNLEIYLEGILDNHNEFIFFPQGSNEIKKTIKNYEVVKHSLM